MPGLFLVLIHKRIAETEKVLCALLNFSVNLAKPIDKRKKKVYNHFVIEAITNHERRLEQ